MGGTMKVIKSVILSLIIGGLTIAAGEQIENADKVEDTIVNSDESGDALESRVLEGTPHYTGTGNLRQGKQLRGLALRLGDAARRAAVRDELTRQGTLAAIQNRRQVFWERINAAMDREELVRQGNMGAIAQRRRNAENFLLSAQRKEEQRRRNNIGAVANTVNGLFNMVAAARNNEAIRSLRSQQAIRNLLSRTGANTSRAAQTALAPFELLNPRNIFQYWANYANFVTSKQQRRNGKRRLDSDSELLPGVDES